MRGGQTSVNPSRIARRYAKALFELSVEEGRFEQTGQELGAIGAAVDSDPELVRALSSPSTTREDRLGMAEALIAALKPGPALANALRLMAERRRLAELSSVARVYRDLTDERSGRLRARVISAKALPDEAAQRIGAALSAATRHEVVLERSVDPALLGGAVAQLGSRVFDGSVKNQIAQLKQQLKA